MTNKKLNAISRLSAISIFAFCAATAQAQSPGESTKSNVDPVKVDKSTKSQKTKNSKSSKVEKKTAVGTTYAMTQAAIEGRYPAPIASMIEKGRGVKVLDVFDASSGLTGFVLSAGNGERRIYYATPDGATVIYGMAFNAQLKNLTNAHLAQFTNPLAPSVGVGTIADQGSKEPVTTKPEEKQQDLWSTSALNSVNAQAGNSALAPNNQVLQAPKVEMSAAFKLATNAQGMHIEGTGLPVYIVFDPACPYCHKAYKDTRNLLGQLKIHWIPVGALSPRSNLLAERFLRSKDKGAAMVASLSRELEPMESLSIEAATLLNSNLNILNAAGATSVPLILYADKGQARQFSGAPSAVQIQELLRVAGANIANR